jgi:type I restriction enzyme M protein
VWTNDPYGRNFAGVPPQGRAGFAFFQHIICSLKPNTGRCAILFPHGVVVCRMNKPAERPRNILFINAVAEVTRGRGQSFLDESHIGKIHRAYRAFQDFPPARRQRRRQRRKRPAGASRSDRPLPGKLHRTT